MIIYRTINLINKKIYVGMDCNNNPNYLGSGIILNKAIKKYGKENFKKEILEYCDIKNINQREIYWIEKLNARDKGIGYNINIGGDVGRLGIKHTKKALKKMSEKLSGINSPWYGRKHTKESKAKISASHIGIVPNKKSRIKMSKHSFWKGKKHSNSYKKQISLKLRGRPFTKEHRRNLSASQIGYKNHNYGKHPIMTKIQKRKISKKLKGRIFTKEWKTKLSIAAKARVRSSSDG